MDSALAPRINDLVLLRHTVAHHGAIIRNIDVSRFQYYAVQPGHLINPPVGFVRETAGFIYEVGREFERTVQKRVFSVVLKSLAPEWYQNPPELVVHLIELFNFLGKLLTDDDPLILPNDPSQIEAYLVERGARGRAKLVDLCVQDLRATYGP